MPLPLVSVVTPTYNRADFLAETVESVLGQDYANLEFIVIDDGSTDHTHEILARYTGRIRWVSHPNMGEAHTVNKGWAMARGEYLVTLSSDDTLLPGHLSRMVRFLESHPTVLAAYPDYLITDARSRVICRREVPDYDYQNMLRWHYCLPGPGTLMRRRVLELAGMRDPSYRYLGDYAYWLRLGLLGPLARVPESLATWRVHAGAGTISGRGAQLAEEHVRMVERFFTRADLPADVRALRRESLASAHYVAGIASFPQSPGAGRSHLWQAARSCALRPWIRPENRPFAWGRVTLALASVMVPSRLHRRTMMAALRWQWRLRTMVSRANSDRNRVLLEQSYLGDGDTPSVTTDRGVPRRDPDNVP